MISAPFQKQPLGWSPKTLGICVVSVVDLPISLAFDTVLLPYDAIISAAKDKETAQPDGAANRSQPVGSETNQAPAAAGSDR